MSNIMNISDTKFIKEPLKNMLRILILTYLLVNSTILNNKYFVELSGHLPINKNRKGGKDNIIVERNKIPLIEPILVDSTVHDSKLAIETINELL